MISQIIRFMHDAMQDFGQKTDYFTDLKKIHLIPPTIP